MLYGHLTSALGHFPPQAWLRAGTLGEWFQLVCGNVELPEAVGPAPLSLSGSPSPWEQSNLSAEACGFAFIVFKQKTKRGKMKPAGERQGPILLLRAPWASGIYLFFK